MDVEVGCVVGLLCVGVCVDIMCWRIVMIRIGN